MRRVVAVRFAVVAACFALVGVLSVAQSRPTAQHTNAQKQAHLSFEAPEQAYLDQRLRAGNHPLAADTFSIISQQAQAIRAKTFATDPTDAGQQWTFDGPTNIDGNSNDGGGRVPDVAVDPAHAGTVYIATAGGGIWKTTDGGATTANMTSVWPITNSQAIGAIAVGQDGTVWAGTGETNPGGGSITFYGNGVFRSLDGGASWQNIGLNDSWTIGRIIVDVTDPNTVWVAASGNLFIAGHQRGLYVSHNALSATPTWTLSLGPGADPTTPSTLTTTTGAVDIAQSHQNPGTLYAAFWDHQRSRDTWAYTGVGSSVWKSTNGGTTWTDLTSPANALTDHLIADHNADVGRIGLAVAPSDDHFVYVNYANETEGAQVAFFTSTDGGSTFTEDVQTSADFTAGVQQASYVYGWWFAKTFVDPVNPQHVFVTGLCLWQSTNAASSVSSNCSVHADQHAMAWDPNLANTVYLGDDGGFYRSTNNGSTFTPAVYQPWPQFDGLDVSEQNPARIVGGLQDNGSQRNWNSAGQTVGQDQWNSIDGGDGQQNVINPANQNIVYSCYQYGACQVSTDGGNSAHVFDGTPLSGHGCPGCTTTTRNAYFTPIALDPINPHIAYYAGDEVNESQNDGGSWTLISSNLGGPSTGSNTDPLYAGHYGAATTIAVSKSNDNIVWIGTDTGCIWYTQNALTNNASVSWTLVSGPCGPSATPPAATALTTTLPTSFVSKILIDPTNSQNVFVAFSGFRSGDNSAFVERTNDGGHTWVNLTGDLPEVTVNSLALAHNRLYAANDTGVYVSAPGSNPLTDSSLTWSQLGNNLPASQATMLRYVPTNDTLYVSTFGRGVWSLPLTTLEAGVPEVGVPVLLPLAGMGFVALTGVVVRRIRKRR